MRRNELLKIIEKAAREGITELDLSGRDITEVPPEIGQLTQLEKLNLGLRYDEQLNCLKNKLSSLPPEIAQLTNLSELYLSANQLSSLPPEIAQLNDDS